jgi:hypothetical protein
MDNKSFENEATFKILYLRTSILIKIAYTKKLKKD